MRQRLILKPTKAKLAVLAFGMDGYSWRVIPRARQLPSHLKRIFNQRTLRGLERAGFIKFRPAAFYVTGKGRKYFRQHRGSAA